MKAFNFYFFIAVTFLVVSISSNAFCKVITICPFACDAASFQRASWDTKTDDFVVWKVSGYSAQAIPGFVFYSPQHCPDIIYTTDRSNISSPGLVFQTTCVASGEAASGAPALVVFGFTFKNSLLEKKEGSTVTSIQHNCFEGDDAGYKRTSDTGLDSSKSNYFLGNNMAFNFESGRVDMISNKDLISCAPSRNQKGIVTGNAASSSWSIFSFLKAKGCKLVAELSKDTDIKHGLFTGNEALMELNGRITVELYNSIVHKNGENASCGTGGNSPCSIFSFKAGASGGSSPTLKITGLSEAVGNGGILFSGKADELDLSGLFSHKGDGNGKRMFSTDFEALSTVHVTPGQSGVASTFYAANEKLPFKTGPSVYSSVYIRDTYLNGFDEIEIGGTSNVSNSEFIMGKNPFKFSVGKKSGIKNIKITPTDSKMIFNIFGTEGARALTGFKVLVNNSYLPSELTTFKWAQDTFVDPNPLDWSTYQVDFRTNNWGGIPLSQDQRQECDLKDVLCNSSMTSGPSLTPQQPSDTPEIDDPKCANLLDDQTLLDFEGMIQESEAYIEEHRLNDW